MYFCMLNHYYADIHKLYAIILLHNNFFQSSQYSLQLSRCFRVFRCGPRLEENKFGGPWYQKDWTALSYTVTVTVTVMQFMNCSLW